VLLPVCVLTGHEEVDRIEAIERQTQGGLVGVAF